MKEKTVIIIGAGIAGLATGCYAQMNGYRSRIFEMHDLPGGLCTAWERKQYIFDGCIHYLFGTAQGQPFHQLWEELGIAQSWQIIHHDELMRVVDVGGRTFIAYCDPVRLEEHMMALSPADSRLIKTFTDGIRLFTRFDMSLMQQKPKDLMTFTDWLKLGRRMLPFALPLAQWGMISARDFAYRFKAPLLRKAIPLVFGWDEIPLMAGMSLLAYMHRRNAGFPLGGSLEFARSLERRYLELRGEIHYKAQVEKVLVEDDCAIGVRLYNDEIYHADLVISAADGHGTIFDMLEGRYINRAIRKIYNGHLPIHSQFQVSLGVNRDLSHEPHWVTYLLKQPVLIGGEERHEIGVKHYCFDPSMAPPGKSVIEVMLRSSYPYWQRIYGRRLYDSEQTQVSDLVIEQLEQIYPGLRKDIEFVDEATPVSYERYTGNWLGSTTGWLLTKDTMMLMIRGMRKTLPGLKNFYMAGQWVEPGGTVPIVAMSGRNVIQMICHADQRPFITSL